MTGQIADMDVGRMRESLLCQQLAAYYSAERETSISADGSNTESRARNYAYRAKDYRAAYFAGIGKADPVAQAASGGAGAPRL